MKEWFHATRHVEANLKLDKGGKEKNMDSIIFKEIVCSLRYVCNCRPNICFVVVLVSRFMDNPKRSHIKAIRRILKWLRGTMDCEPFISNFCKWFRYIDHILYKYKLYDKVDMRSNIGNYFSFFYPPISCFSRK